MTTRITDPQLLELPRETCPRCSAEATPLGRMVLDDSQRWQIEFRCTGCGAEVALWSAGREALTRAIANKVSDISRSLTSPMLSGSISDSELLRRPPPPPRPRPAPREHAGPPEPPPPYPTRALPFYELAQAEDLENRVPGVLFLAMPDYDSSSPHRQISQLYLSDSGFSAKRVELGRQIVENRTGVLPADVVREEFARIAALQPRRFRSQIGFVRSRCDLDCTHLHRLSFFDGVHLHSMDLVFGTERRLGATYGDVQPRDHERAALDRMADLLERARP